jgi:hypothetical protein
MKNTKWHCAHGPSPHANPIHLGWPKGPHPEKGDGAMASPGGGGRPNPDGCRQRGAAGGGWGASRQGDGPDLGQQRGVHSPDGLVHGGVD